ncbi:hypothetical protein [Calothrix sp. PCC 7507]|uniref:hypothetical protein n=1 Tax=Calothrix sp. PCC 7507 TaxID=99598 RepID=UPI00029F0C1F|nr:hypothetical protein [Calothrix sp. PCC 7507]AFY34878.1 hypothetical protein Cal7507_4509 [Calothrix sp. PCC 7507]
MAEPTLIQVFGINAVQTSTTLTITKADLAAVGLTASANNSAESLLVAILQLAKIQLSVTNLDSNIDQSIAIDGENLPTFVIRNSTNYQRDTISIQLDKLVGPLTIDPDDY